MSAAADASFIHVDKLWPVLMRRDEIMTIQQAMHHSGKSSDTIRRWCVFHGISRQSARNAPLEISAPALEMVLHNDMLALALLRAGKRSHPAVLRYFEHLGLEPWAADPVPAAEC